MVLHKISFSFQATEEIFVNVITENVVSAAHYVKLPQNSNGDTHTKLAILQEIQINAQAQSKNSLKGHT